MDTFNLPEDVDMDDIDGPAACDDDRDYDDSHEPMDD